MSDFNDQLYITSAYNGNIDNVINSDNIYLKSLNICKISGYNYLYTITYGENDYTYAEAEAYYKHKVFDGGEEPAENRIGCSSFHKGNFCGRNLDWTYSHSADFIISTPTTEDRHGVIGVAGDIPELSANFVDSGENSEFYKYLPFRLLDGVNDAGLYCNSNIVPAGDLGHTTQTNPGAKQVYAATLVRYILDNCATVDEAIDLIKSLNIYSSKSYEYHIMVANANKTAVIEFVHNKISIITDDSTDEYLNFPNNDTPVMTNFYLSKYVDENTITSLDSSKIRAIEQNTITESDTDLTAHAMGVERYKLLAANLEDVNSIDSAMAAIKLAKCTKSYTRDTNPFWYTEFTGENASGDFTIYNPQADYDELVDIVINNFPNASRDTDSPYFGYWQTTHTSVYDLENCTLTVCAQEMIPTQYSRPLTFYLTSKI